MSQQSNSGAVSATPTVASKPPAGRGLLLGKRAARPPKPWSSHSRAPAASAAKQAASVSTEKADEDAAGKEDEDSERKDSHDAVQGDKATDDAEEEEDDDSDRGENSSDDDADGDILIDINTKRERQRKQDSRRKRHRTAHTGGNSQTTADSGSTTTAEKQDEQEEMINVEFGLFDPLPVDALTFRLLLKDLVPEHLLLPSTVAAASSASSSSSASAAPSRSAFALHEFCSLLAEQAVVGTTVKADGTDEPLGFISLVPLSPRFGSAAPLPPAVQQLVSYLSSSVPSSHSQRLSALLPVLSRPSFSSSPPLRTALLVQSRLVNVPIPLIGPLHRALLEDVAWAQQQPDVGDDWRLQRALLLGRCSSVSGRMRGGAGGGSGGEVWQRWEEEVYLKESEWACRWRVAVRPEEDGGEEGGARAGDAAARRGRDAQFAVLMCLTWEAMQRAVQQIEQMASGA